MTHWRADINITLTDEDAVALRALVAVPEDIKTGLWFESITPTGEVTVMVEADSVPGALAEALHKAASMVAP